MRSSNPGTLISVKAQASGHQEYIERMSSWHVLAGEMVGSASIVEKSLDEIFDLRHRSGVGFPNRAGVVSSGALGLLATLILRLRGIEVFFMDLEVMPVCQTHKAAPHANKSRKFSRYHLSRRRLAKEVGAAFADANTRTIRKSAEKLGPFDLIFLDSANSFTVMQALFGLNGTHGLSPEGARPRHSQRDLRWRRALHTPWVYCASMDGGGNLAGMGGMPEVLDRSSR